MSKQHRDFVTYVRNGVEINALVAFSHDVYTPATQTEEAKTVEHLTLVYLDPASATNSIQTGEQLRGSIKTEFSVPPLIDGLVNGWKEAIEDYVSDDSEKDAQIVSLQKQVEELGASLKDADAAKTEIEAELVEANAKVAALTPQASTDTPPAPAE